ncbi:hypothetical protein T07_12144, partial [Trichinella nelsoni]
LGISIIDTDQIYRRFFEFRLDSGYFFQFGIYFRCCDGHYIYENLRLVFDSVQLSVVDKCFCNCSLSKSNQRSYR